MKTMITSALIATGLTLGAPLAAAQTSTDQSAPAQSTTEPTTPATPGGTMSAGATVSDAEVTAFAQSAAEIQKVQEDIALADADKQKQMVEILEKHSLTPQRFNEIAQTMQSDQALQERIRTAMQANASTAG